MDRRQFGGGVGALLLAGCARGSTTPGANAGTAMIAARKAAGTAALTAIEARSGGRLGAFVLDTASGQGFGLRQGERFGMCSTFKLSLCAYLLREGDAGRLDLGEVLPYTRADLLGTSPVTTANIDKGGMSISALAEATQQTSDNAAANLLLRRIGGPAALTRFWRDLGDTTARLDRFEPELNLVPPGEVRDTVTPEGIARSVARFVLGDILVPASRARLQGWMEATQTGARRIRAGLPATWRGGDKTGTGGGPGMNDKYNDIAVLWPPAGRAPLVVVGFLEADGAYDDMRPQDEAVLRQLGEVAVQWAS